jgi:hypothetical protein
MIIQTKMQVKIIVPYMINYQKYTIMTLCIIPCFIASGVLDSSGIKFTYTVEPQKQRAGILSSGYNVHSGMIIPPGRKDYTITSLCPGECTERVNIMPCTFTIWK